MPKKKKDDVDKASTPTQREKLRLLKQEARAFARPGTKKFGDRARARRRLIKNKQDRG
jgi:hypothetical protein